MPCRGPAGDGPVGVRVSAAGVEDAFRRCWPQVLAATVRVTRDLDVAEDCVQDAFVKASTVWSTDPPRNGAAWLTTAARNRAVDRMRRETTLRQKLPLLVMDDDAHDVEEGTDLLRLVFTCAHPALPRGAQLALTLRLIGGLSVAEIAAGLLLEEATVAARITRAKQKIAVAGVPFRVPPDSELSGRVGVVLDVVHLIHTAGHTAVDSSELTRPDMSLTGRELARLLTRLMPDDSEVQALLALCLLDDARLGAESGKRTS